MKLRSVGLALTLLAGGTVIGATAQHLASATLDSGERPVLTTITACRITDTRPGENNTGPKDTPLGAGQTMTVDAQQTGTDCTGQIPTDATALDLNVTGLRATDQTFITIWPGGTLPTASSLNPAPGQPPVPNAVTTPLSVDQTFDLYNDLGTVDLVIDITGYYQDHNHDDRYYTESEVDALLSPPPPDVERLNVFGFSLMGDWNLANTLQYPGAGARQCMVTPIDGQTGRFVTSIDVTYDSDGTVAAGFTSGAVSLRKDPGPIGVDTTIIYHLFNLSTPLPEPPLDTSVTVTIEDQIAPSIGAIPDPDDWSTLVFLCFDTAVDVEIYGVDVNFGDAAPARPAAPAPSSELPDLEELLGIGG